MDLILTPIVQRMLRAFIKRTADGTDLKASFGGRGALRLHNLELNLDPLLSTLGASVSVRRAFARELKINIPWTALTTQPIQVVLDTVELIFGEATADDGQSPSQPDQLADGEKAASGGAAQQEAVAGNGGSSSWLGGTLQSIALRAGLNVSVQVRNFVCKWVQDGQFVAAATCQQLLLQTSDGNWRESLQNPEAWLCKLLTIRHLTFSLDQHLPSGLGHCYPPLLRTSNVAISAVLPIFAHLEGADLAGDAFKTSVSVDLQPIHLSVNDCQLRWALDFGAFIQQMAAAKKAAAAAAESAAQQGSPAWPPGSPRSGLSLQPPPATQAHAPPTVASPAGRKLLSSPASAHRMPRPETKALGVFGRVWDFMVDEATYAESTEAAPAGGSPLAGISPSGSRPAVGHATTEGNDDASDWQEIQRVPMHAELTLRLQQLEVHLGLVQELQAGTGSPPSSLASSNSRMQQQEDSVARIHSLRPDLSDTLQQLHSVTSLEDALRLQQQLSAALREEVAAEGPGGTDADAQRQAAFRIHAVARLSLSQLAVTVASVDSTMQAVAVQLAECVLLRDASTAETAAQLLLQRWQQQCPDRPAAADTQLLGSDCWLEVLALQPGQPAAQGSSAGQLLPPVDQGEQRQAVSVHWLGTAADGAASQQQCTVHIGSLRATHAVGFLITLVLLTQQAQAQGAQSSASGSSTGAQKHHTAKPQASFGQPQGGEQQQRQQQGWLHQVLAGEVLLDFDVDSIQLAVRASQAVDAAAVVLTLVGLQSSSGSLDWKAPQVCQLRQQLLAPKGGFPGSGLCVALPSAALGVAEAGSSGLASCHAELWAAAAPVSSNIQLQAIISSSLAAAAADQPPARLASLALSPMQLRFSGAQLATLFSIISAASAEMQCQCAVPLVSSPPADTDAAPWLASLAVSVSQLQAAYAGPGSSVQGWADADGMYTVPASLSAPEGEAEGSQGKQWFVGSSSIETSAVVAAAEPSHQALAVHLRVGQPHLWLSPGLRVVLPMAEVLLGPSAAAGPADYGQPVIMLAGFEYASVQGWQQVKQAAEAAGDVDEVCWKACSAVLSMSWQTYQLLTGQLLAPLRQQPMLSPTSSVQPAEPAQQQQQLAQADTEASHATGRSASSSFTISVDAASATLWPEQQHGLAVWLTSYAHSRQSAGDTSNLQVTLGSLQAALLRQPAAEQEQAVHTASWLRLAASQQVSSEQRQAAVQATLSTLPAHATSGHSALKRVQVTALPVDLAITPLLLTVIRRLLSDLIGSGSESTSESKISKGGTPPEQQQQSSSAAGQVEQLHARIALHRISARLCQQEEWGSGEATLSRSPCCLLPTRTVGTHAAAQAEPAMMPAVLVTIDETVVLVHQQLAAENRPWLARAPHSACAVLTSMDGTLMGSEIVVCHAGPRGCDRTTLLPPTDLRLQLLLQPHTATKTIVLHAAVLPLQVSLPAVTALGQVVSLLQAGGDADEQKPAHPQSGAHNVPAPQQQQPLQQEQQQLDDLRSLLFTYVASDGEGHHPRPLQVQALSTATGSHTLSRLWGGSSTSQQQMEHAISWTYSLPRAVMSVLIEDVPASMLGSQLELAYYLPAAQDHIALPVKAAVLNSAASSSLLLLAESPLVATEWQLTWATTAAEGQEAAASALLHHLHINPPLSPAMSKAAASLGLMPIAPPPLPAAPFTVALTADNATVSLLAQAPQLLPPPDAHPDRMALVHSVALLQADSLRLAMHSWPEALGSAASTAFDAQAVLSLSCTDSSSMAGPCGAAPEGLALIEPFTLDVAIETCHQLSTATLATQQEQQQQTWQAFWQPAQQLCNDLSLLTVRQRPTQPGTAVLVGAGQQPLRLNISELAVSELQRHCHLLSAAGEAAELPAVSIGNGTGMDLILRQQGTRQQLIVPQGSALPFCWPAPPPLFPGAVRRLLVAWALNSRLPADESNLHWSEPIEILARGTQHLLLRHPTFGCCTSIAVQVQRTPLHTWEVRLLPGLCLVNHLPTPICCHISSGVQQSQQEVVEVAANGSSTDLQLVEATAMEGGPARSGQLRLWLGSSSGWSQALELRLQGLKPVVEVLCPERRARGRQSNSKDLGPPVGAERQQQAPIGVVLAQALQPDAATGQASVVLWPPLTLHNHLPCPLFLSLPALLHGGSGSKEGSQQQQQQEQRLKLAPGAATTVAVLPQGGEVLRASLSATSRDSVPIIAPGVASPADAEGFAASTAAFPAAASSASDALYLPPPGNAALLQLPGRPVCAGFAARNAVSVWLLTEQHSEELPLLRIKLLPQAVAYNCLPMPVQLQLPGCAPVDVPAAGRVLLDWQGHSDRPHDAILQLTAPAQPPGRPGAEGLVGQTVTLQSLPFSLERATDAHLVLSSSNQHRAASAGGSGLFGRRGSGQGLEGQGQDGRLECRVAARVKVAEHADGMAESVAITLTTGCFVSNLTGLPLNMQLQGVAAELDLPALAAAHSSSLASLSSPALSAGTQQLQGEQAPSPPSSETSPDSIAGPQPHSAAGTALPLPEGTTQPLLHLWGSFASGDGAAAGVGMVPRHQRSSSWGASDLFRTFSSSKALNAEAARPAHAPQAPVGTATSPGLRFAIMPPLPGQDGATDPDLLPTPQTPAPELQPLPHGLPLRRPAAALEGWSVPVSPFQPVERQRFYLRGLDGTPIMVTYRVLLNRGHLHLVLFKDRQPPFVIDNGTGRPLEVGFFPPEELPDGGFAYERPASALKVGPGQKIECDFRPSHGRPLSGEEVMSPRRASGSAKADAAPKGGWEDQEDEDAFLDCLLQEELRASGQQHEQPPAVLKFREPGAKHWQHPCVLQPGAYEAGPEAEVLISKTCASTHIVLRPPAGAASSASSSPWASPQQQLTGSRGSDTASPVQPLQVFLHLRQVQVCLWDDERRRLLPPRLCSEREHSSSSSGSSVAGLVGQELFYATLDGLQVLLARTTVPAAETAASTAGPAAGAAAAGQQQQQQVVYSAQLALAALQIDSCLPDSEHPVLLTSLPVERPPGSSGGAEEGQQQPPLHLLLEVCHAPPSNGSGRMSFRNAWVHRLLVRLPVLAVCLDDSLLLFATHAQQVLGSPSSAVDPAAPLLLLSAATAGSAEEIAAGDHSGQQQQVGRALDEPEQLAQELKAEAVGAAASRLFLQTAVVEPVRLLVDVHIAAGTAGVPVDTHRAPLTLSRIAAHEVLFRPHVLVRGLMAHGVAEAVLNAPQMLGSLQLLFNPTGLVHSVRQGVADLIGLPLAALQARSPTQFLSGLGLGSVSLVRHISGWTLTSIAGFSHAFTRAVDSAVAIREGAASRRRPSPEHLGHGLAQGLAGLAGGVAAGVTAVVKAPMQSYSSGGGVLGGIGRGLLGAVGLPVSGALELVGSTAEGLARSAGISHNARRQRSGRVVQSQARTGEGWALSPARLLQQPALAAVPGRCVEHAPAEAATLLVGTQSVASTSGAGSTDVDAPVLLLLDAGLLVCAAHGTQPLAYLPLAGLTVEEHYSLQQLSLFSSAVLLFQETTAKQQQQQQQGGGVAGGTEGSRRGAAGVTVHLNLGRAAWLRIMPPLRRLLAHT